MSVWRLDTAPRQVVGYYHAEPAPRREGGGTAGAVLELRDTSLLLRLEEDFEPIAPAPGERVVEGTLVVVNTKEAFQALDKTALLAQVEGQPSGAAGGHDDGNTANLAAMARSAARFVLLIYADWKTYHHVHWLAFPAAVTSTPPPATTRADADASGADVVPPVPVVHDIYRPVVTSWCRVAPPTHLPPSPPHALPHDGTSAASSSPVAAVAAELWHQWHGDSTSRGAASLSLATTMADAHGLRGGYIAFLRAMLAAASHPPRPSAPSAAATTTTITPVAPTARVMLPNANRHGIALAVCNRVIDGGVAWMPARIDTGSCGEVGMRATPTPTAVATSSDSLTTILQGGALLTVVDCGATRDEVEGGAGQAPSLAWPVRNVLTAIGHAVWHGGASGSDGSPATIRLHLLVLRPDGQAWVEAERPPTTATAAPFPITTPVATPIAMDPHAGINHDRSLVMQVTLQRPASMDAPASGDVRWTYIGWELNGRGQPGPRTINLRASMDPATIAAASANLNLELMRWRMLPELSLPTIRACKCLLLGAGTLGCHVARDLVAWGFQDITLLDAGRVSMSNPTRQPLFELADATGGEGGGGRWKAAAAEAALRRIHPSLHLASVVMHIPMPGHPVSLAERPGVAAAIAKLDDQIRACDVVFLLTDTRESRWLPTLLAAAHGKLAITVALGFDTWLAMRHGVPAPIAASSTVAGAGGSDDGLGSGRGSKLGCYFCNDVVAPTDSTTNRTLDQQCTVTRPGCAPISSAYAVELLVALLHHPAREHAPADTSTPITTLPSSPLGLLPHQIRGFVTHYHQLLLSAASFDRCPACSNRILQAYARGGLPWLWSVFEDGAQLERATGLDELHASMVARVSETPGAGVGEEGADDGEYDVIG